LKRIVAIDLGGSPSHCAVAPENRRPHCPETIGALIASTRERWPKADLEVGFFHGGIPTMAQMTACEGLPMRLSVHPADLSPDNAKGFRDAGGVMIELEAMSFDPHTLRTNLRQYTPDRVRLMAKNLQQMGFKVGVHLVTGLPGADVEGALCDVADICASDPPWVDFVRIWPALGFEGAILSRWAQTGAWVPWDLNQTVNVVGQMVEGFDAAGVTVIRLGVQPGQDIPVRAVAGPVHPNLRSKIEARRFSDRIRLALVALFQAAPSQSIGAVVLVAVNEKDLGWAKGVSNINGRTLTAHFGLTSLRFVSEPCLERGTVRVKVAK